MTTNSFDWSDLAFQSKKPVRELKATFIMAPRHISPKRFTQLIKTYLPAGNIVLGIAKEQFVDGFEGQPQFKTLAQNDVQSIIDKVNASTSPHKLYTLCYFQRELPFLLEKLTFKKVIGINGSWSHVFHASPAFYQLVKTSTSYQLVSPFSDEDEARDYALTFDETFTPALQSYSAKDMLKLADQAAQKSFDYTYQTGVTLGRKEGAYYTYITAAFNRVVPYQTYAMHHGASREIHFSPMQDLNYYDTIHAEVALMVEAQKERIELAGTTLFINLLPCPTCARMFAATDISEFVYREDHSDGYAVRLLELAGKKVTRIVKEKL